MKISKVDVADGKELEGAKIQLLENGSVIDEWVSGKEPHEIVGLKTGVEYVLRETVAPNGYEITTDITFTIDQNGKINTTAKVTDDGIILIEDSKIGGPGKSTTTKRKDSTRTGDDANALLWLMLALGSAGTLGYLSTKRRNAR